MEFRKRETHYGFTVDDGPFYYAIRGGEVDGVYNFSTVVTN